MPLRPHRPRRTRQSLFGVAALGLLLAAVFLSSAGTASTSVGSTGSDSRAFPRTFHIWGGYPSSYTKYDLVIGYPAWDIASLRSADPGAIFLLNVMLDPWNSDWHLWKGLSVTYGAAESFSGATDTVTDGSAVNLGTIPAWNSYWDTLRHPDGTVAVVNTTEGHPGWNLARTDTAEKVAKIEAYGAKLSKVYRNGWDGIWSDNWIYRIGADWFYGTNLDTNRDGQADDMGTLSRQWWDGLTLTGQRLREYLPGKIVGGNGSYHVSGLVGGTDPNGPFKTSDVTMNEVLQLYTTQPDTVVSEVQSYLGFADPYGMPRYFLLKHKLPGGQTDYRSMRWGFSLATIAGGYYEPFASNDDDAFSYDEFTGGTGVARRGWLGQPVSAPAKLSNGVWRRDFANGVVLNNSTSSAQTVSLGATYQRLKGTQDTTVNNGATVTSVTVPAGDGLFLVGSSSSSTSTTTAPQNVTPPVISGTPTVGQTLLASTGSWSGSPTSYAYRWQRCNSTGATCVDLSTATSPTYALTSADAGSTMRVGVTASNAIGSTTAVSAPTVVVSTGSTSLPSWSIVSSIGSGQTLTGSVLWTVTVSGLSTSSVKQVDFSIDGGLKWTEFLSPYVFNGDAGSLATATLSNGTHTFSAKVTTTAGSTSTTTATATVSNGTLTGTAPANTGLPAISGTTQVGQTLTAAAGSWSGSPTSYAYQWQRCDSAGTGCGAISAATSQTYALASTDANSTMRVRVTATNSLGSASATSAQTALVTVPTSTLGISSSIQSGHTLTGNVSWTATVSGVPTTSVTKVEFLIDGILVWTESASPYVCYGDGKTLPISTLGNGWHDFTVKVTTTSGATASNSARVKVLH